MINKETDQVLPSQCAIGTIGTFEETARRHLKSTWEATPAQRLAWLEEALEFAYRAGSLKPRRPLKE